MRGAPARSRVDESSSDDEQRLPFTATGGVGRKGRGMLRRTTPLQFFAVVLVSLGLGAALANVWHTRGGSSAARAADGNISNDAIATCRAMLQLNGNNGGGSAGEAVSPDSITVFRSTRNSTRFTGSSIAGSGLASMEKAVVSKESGWRNSFYAWPQLQARYPGRTPYTFEHNPLCHYSQPTDQPASSKDELQSCIVRAEESYKQDNHQASKLPCEKRRRVFDAFRYNDEDVMLETRIEENWHVIDYFIVIESPMAFSGIPKKMAFAERAAAGDYDKWMDKIIHVVCELSHISVDGDNPDNLARGWTREFATEDCIQFGLATALPDDLIMFSDVDEVPQPRAVSALQMCSQEMTALSPGGDNFLNIRFNGPRFLGSWKWQHYPGFPEKWTGTTIVPRKALFARPGSGMRGKGIFGSLLHVTDGLWHCSMCFFGNKQLLLNKLDMWSELGASKAIREQMFDPNEKRPHAYDDCGASKDADTCTLWTNTKALPEWVQHHPEQFKDKGFTA